MRSREDLATAHTEPPLDRVTLAHRQPDPAWTQNVPHGPDGRQRHLSAVWDMVLESRGVQGTLRIHFPCPIVVMGGSNLPEGQELVGLFAYRLASGHSRVQTGVAWIGEEGTVTTAAVFGLNVVTGWEKRRPEWVDMLWLAMRVNVGRQWKTGGADVIDIEGEDEPPPPPPRPGSGKAAPPPKGDTEPPPPPPESPAYGRPGGAGGAGRAGGRAGVEGGDARVGGAAVAAAAGGGVGGARDQRGGRQPRLRGPPVQRQRGQAGRRVAFGGRHQGAGPPRRQGENLGARPGDGVQGRGGTGKAAGTGRGGG